MKRNKLCIIIAILTSIFLFGTAAVYNQCSTSTETITGKVEEEITPEGEKKSEEVIEGEEEGAEEETLHKETEKISEEEAVAETQAPEEAIEGEESVDENGGMGGGEKDHVLLQLSSLRYMRVLHSQRLIECATIEYKLG